jgi:hypothetical protein
MSVVMEDKKDSVPESALETRDTDEQIDDNSDKEVDSENFDATIAKGLSPDVLEFVKKLPPEDRTEVHKLIKETTVHGLMMSSRGGMPSDPEFLKQQDEHQFQVAIKGIDASQIDRRETRATDLVKFKIKAGITFGLIVLLFIFSGIAMYTGNTNFVSELLKIAGYAVGGLGGGVILFRSKR